MDAVTLTIGILLIILTVTVGITTMYFAVKYHKPDAIHRQRMNDVNLGMLMQKGIDRRRQHARY